MTLNFSQMGNKFFMFTGFLLFCRLNVQHDVCIKFLEGKKRGKNFNENFARTLYENF